MKIFLVPIVKKYFWTSYFALSIYDLSFFLVRAMIKKETDEYGIPANRIVLGGFSMVHKYNSWKFLTNA